MSDASESPKLFTIGELSRRSGMAVRTIRFWSDAGVVPETSRSRAGYRLYDAEALARLELVRTLRELGLQLSEIERVLRAQATLAEVAETHARALDAEIRVLRTRRAVLRSVARRSTTTEEMKMMHKLAQLSAAERQQLIDDFVDAVFEGAADDGPGAHIARGMRTLPTELPDDPTPEQVDAWIELAELVSDEGFRERCRQMALGGNGGGGGALEIGYDHERALEHAKRALANGIPASSQQAQETVELIFGRELSSADRGKLADRLDSFSDSRVERYWQLLGALNGWPRAEPQVPAMEWLISALRAVS